MNLTPPTYKILYNNKNITADISEHLVSLSYTDKVEGEADEFQMSLEDADGLWQNEWYPDKGATLYAEIETAGIVLKCGLFGLDEPGFSISRSAGDTVSIKGVSAFFTKALRTKKHTAHENKTLLEIARSVADKHGFTIQGSVPDIPVARVTQKHKTDLEFLQKLANSFGFIFSVRGSVMVFTDVTELEKGLSVYTIKKADLIGLDITDKSSGTYKKANLQFHNPDENTTVDYSTADDEEINTDDTLVIKEKAENKQQAERIAKTKLYKANSFQKEGSFSVPGNPLLVSGVNFQLIHCGKLSGLYHVLKSEHSITRSDGYITSCDIKQVGTVPESLYKV